MSERDKRVRAAALFAGMVLLSALFAVQGALLTEVIREFSLTDSMQGLYSAAASAGGITAFIAALFLIGRVRKTVLLFWGALLSAAGLLLVSLMTAFPAFVLMWFVIGVGMGLQDTLLSSCMADLYTGKKGSKMMCMLHMTYGIASMVIPPVCTLLSAGEAGFRGAFRGVAASGIPVLLIMIFAFFGKSRKTDRGGDASGTTGPAGLIPLMKKGALVILLSIACLAASLIESGVLKSGSPTDILIMSMPCALSSELFADISNVAEGESLSQRFESVAIL